MVYTMRLYLAGTGIAKDVYRGAYETLLSGDRKQSMDSAGSVEKGGDAMRIYLAGENGKKKLVSQAINENPKLDIAILESFYYIDQTSKMLIPHIKHYILDSGAFTFFSSGKNVNFDSYVEKYGAFIKEYDIKLYFELDIDKIVGFDKVLQYRKRLEQITGRPPIPVWHVSRGIDRFTQDAKEYPYVALGGIVSGEWSPKAQTKFNWFINEAHRHGAKIHGLGYTSLSGIKKYHFDSVDSTAWTTGNRFGYLYKFTGDSMKTINVPAGKRLKTMDAAYNNFHEWVKFQKYAEMHL